MGKRFVVKTTIPEIYEKLPLLNFQDSVVLDSKNIGNIMRTINIINSTNRFLEMEKYNDHVVIRKINPLSINVYYQ